MQVGTKAKISILNEYLALRSLTAAPWLVYCTLRPGFCWLRLLDDHARRAIRSHGCPWQCTARYRPSAVSRYTQSWSSVSRVYDSMLDIKPKTTEQNRIVRTGKYETEVGLTNNKTRSQSNLTKSASRGAHSPVRGHPRGSKVVPLNSWGRVSY